MFNRLIHPRERTLSDFADKELPPSHARRVAQHVARCARCRDFVWSCRRLDAAAAELPHAGLRPSLRDRVLARHARGEEVILPVPGVPVTVRAAGKGPRRAMAVAAMVVIAAAGALLLGTPTLTAERSELIMTPAAPRTGDSIRIEYHATSRLNVHDTLVLRARHARPNSTMHAVDHTILTRLVRRPDGAYTGAFVLPVDVPYVVLAVEDVRANDVDHNGERWEVVLHDDDSRPLHDALDQQFRDTRDRNRVAAAEIAAAMVRLYPHSVRARFNQFTARRELMASEQADSLRTAHRQALPALLDARPLDALTADELSTVTFYADLLGDTAVARAHRDRLIAAHPLSPAAQQQRVFVNSRVWARDTVAYWTGLEQLWQETEGLPRHAQIAFTGWQVAQQWRDTDALARWGRRLAADGSSDWVGQTFADMPDLRDEGIVMIRSFLETMDDDAERYRALTHTAAEFGAARSRFRGRLLADLGAALAAAGRQAESDEALARAVDLGWHLQLFRTVAETRLQTGDTTAALQLFARVAVDPETSTLFADSVRVRAGSHFEPVRWDAWRADALRMMQHHTMFLATNRPVRGRPRLRDAESARLTLDPASGDITLVAFWSRHCPPSQVQLGQLAQLTRTLQQEDVRVVTITEERPSAQLTEYLAQNGLDFPVLFDTDLEARRAFDNLATPAYLVVDGRGHVRFQSHSLDDIRRQIFLLRSANHVAG